MEREESYESRAKRHNIVLPVIRKLGGNEKKAFLINTERPEIFQTAFQLPKNRIA